MDFEFNQNSCNPANPTEPGSTCDDNTPNGGKTAVHVTPVRVAGDLLITYLLERWDQPDDQVPDVDVHRRRVRVERSDGSFHSRRHRLDQHVEHPGCK